MHVLFLLCLHFSLLIFFAQLLLLSKIHFLLLLTPSSLLFTSCTLFFLFFCLLLFCRICISNTSITGVTNEDFFSIFPYLILNVNSFPHQFLFFPHFLSPVFEKCHVLSSGQIICAAAHKHLFFCSKQDTFNLEYTYPVKALTSIAPQASLL